LSEREIGKRGKERNFKERKSKRAGEREIGRGGESEREIYIYI